MSSNENTVNYRQRSHRSRAVAVNTRYISGRQMGAPSTTVHHPSSTASTCVEKAGRSSHHQPSTPTATPTNGTNNATPSPPHPNGCWISSATRTHHRHQLVCHPPRASPPLIVQETYGPTKQTGPKSSKPTAGNSHTPTTTANATGFALVKNCETASAPPQATPTTTTSTYSPAQYPTSKQKKHTQNSDTSQQSTTTATTLLQPER